MSTISKACLEISKSLKNFKLNRNNTSDKEQSATDQSRTNNQPSTTDQSRTNNQSSSQQNPPIFSRADDSSWSSSGELSVSEALTRVFRQAANRVRSFSSSDRSGCSQSFAVVVPTTSKPSTTTLPTPFLSAQTPHPATNSEYSNNDSESDVLTKCIASGPPENPMESLNVGIEVKTGKVISLPSSPSVKYEKTTKEVKPSLQPIDSFPNIRHRTSFHDDVTFIACPPSSMESLWKDKQFLVQFFKYFSISHLCTLAQVCRLWREILYSDAKYWIDVTPKVNCRELSHNEEPARRDFYASLERRKFDSLCLIGLLDDDIADVIRLFPYSSTGVRKLSVRCSNVSDAGLKRLMDSSSNATSLELNGCNEITEAGLWTCLNHRLTCLTLADCINVADESVSAVAQLLPNLKEFNLQAYHVTDSALSAFSNKQGGCLKTLRLLSCWEITNHGVVNVIRSLPNLTVLSLSGCSKITDDGVEVLAENLRQLKSLDISWCSRITDSSLEYIACDLCVLEELTLDRCSHVSDIGVGYLSTMTSLTHLFLRWCNQVRDFGIQRISSMKNLRVLSLAGCSMVTSSGVTRLTQLSSLRELELTNCPAITSSDLCSYLQDKMPNCIIIE